MLLRKLWIDIAALVEPFVRAISEFAANQESVAPYRTASKTAVSFVIGNILD